LHPPSQQQRRTSPTTQLPMPTTISRGPIPSTSPTLSLLPPLLPRIPRRRRTSTHNLGERALSREGLRLTQHLHRHHYLCLLEARSLLAMNGAADPLDMPPTHLRGIIPRTPRMPRYPLHRFTTLAMAHNAATDMGATSRMLSLRLPKFRPTAHLSVPTPCLRGPCLRLHLTSLIVTSTLRHKTDTKMSFSTTS
jgi:hypothetical protein